MQIHSLQSTSAAQTVNRLSQPHPGSNSVGVSSVAHSAVDELELSSEAQQISQSQGIGSTQGVTTGIRAEKVAALREAIASGAYETPERMSAALDKLLDTFA
jgi:negative regulator of flagellin synthesis FlgM